MTKTSQRDTHVTISYYDRRATDHLERLLKSLRSIDSGAPFDLTVVVNSTSENRIDKFVDAGAQVIYRENTGMNIGAWNHGWHLNREYKFHVFLQDECAVARPGWVEAIQGVLSHSEIGLVGEALNPAWDKSWEALEIAHRGAILPDHFINGKPADRLPTYLHAFDEWGIDKGASGRHLRSLIWAARSSTLERINGFPVGANYGECIAAEIGVSKSIEALGLNVTQISEEPFRYFKHWEWNSNRAGYPALHKAHVNGNLIAMDRLELDTEAMHAWNRAYDVMQTKSTIDHEIAVTALRLKLQDREKEITRLRNLLSKD